MTPQDDGFAGDRPALKIPLPLLLNAAWDLELGLDCAVSVEDFESAVEGLFLALVAAGWTLAPPAIQLDVQRG